MPSQWSPSSVPSKIILGILSESQVPKPSLCVVSCHGLIHLQQPHVPILELAS